MASGNRPPPLALESLDGVVEELLRRRDPTGRGVFALYRIVRVWRRALGERVAARATPVAFADGTLVAAVRGATWLQELQFLREEVRRKLNEALGEELVTGVRFRRAADRP